ncbi:MAG: S8 family serine peptidase [Candidatus Sericytochromatia bacterium]|nr:S8 family serine peptidase [Candidatus Sericytochromatia bacterium]
MDEHGSPRWQWSLRRIEAPQAWQITRAHRDVVVAVVDSGVDSEHPELAGRVLRGFNVLQPRRPSQDDIGHGTAVAGLIAARGNNGRGFCGVAPDCRILPVKVNEPGTGAVSAQHIAQGIRWAVREGATVINASVGVVQWEHGLTEDALEDLADAIRFALKHRVPVICAAGPALSPPPFPGTWSVLWDFRGLISAGGTDRHDRRAACSPTGNFLSVTAPSDGVLTTFPRAQGRLYGTFGGTSAAAPHVTGLAALVLSLRPELKPHEVKRIIQESADRLGGGDYHPEYGFGRINLNRTLKAVQALRAPEHFDGIAEGA